MRKLLVLTVGLAFTTTASALPLVNPGFEDGLNGWNASNGNVFPTTFAPAVASGTTAAAINTNGALTQGVSLDGPGTYEFGGLARFALLGIDPQGIFSQAQISFGVNGVGFVSVGTDPNAVRNTFALDPSGINLSEWISLSGIFNYTGGATTAGLINVNLQGNTLGVLVSYDDVFVRAVPEPGTLGLFAAGLLILWRLRWQRARRPE